MSTTMVSIHVTCPGCHEEADVELDLSTLEPADREVLTRYPKMVAFCVACDVKMKEQGTSAKVVMIDDAKVMYDLLAAWHFAGLCGRSGHRPECAAAVDAYCFPSWEAWVASREQVPA